MTEPTMSTIDPHEDPIGYFFDVLDLPRLEDVIEQGRLVDVIEPEELSAYCSIAAARVSPDGPPGADEMADEFGCRMITVFTGEASNRYRDVGGNPGIIEEDGTITEVTPDRLRHYQWMHAILGSAEMSERLLCAAPEAIADNARRIVADNIARRAGQA